MDSGCNVHFIQMSKYNVNKTTNLQVRVLTAPELQVTGELTHKLQEVTSMHVWHTRKSFSDGNAPMEPIELHRVTWPQVATAFYRHRQSTYDELSTPSLELRCWIPWSLQLLLVLVAEGYDLCWSSSTLGHCLYTINVLVCTSQLSSANNIYRNMSHEHFWCRVRLWASHINY